MTGCGNGGFHVCADIGSFVTLHEILDQGQVADNEPKGPVHNLHGELGRDPHCQVNGDHRVEPRASAIMSPHVGTAPGPRREFPYVDSELPKKL